ncbi:hypothetical protein ABEB36_002885 [Hypothenemus hampei]|uniref:THAP-type domain-containing protein n=1 Tax=Hypothenemus hampei TaxID=57062 RepID=A0ABD1FAZ9_HYPHA
MVYVCCVSGCKNTYKVIKMHCLPKDGKIRKEWCAILDRPDLEKVQDRFERKKFRICDIHFAENSKVGTNRNRTTLKYNAVPTMHLKSAMSMFEHAPTITSMDHNIDIRESTSLPRLQYSNLLQINRQLMYNLKDQDFLKKMAGQTYISLKSKKKKIEMVKRLQH